MVGRYLLYYSACYSVSLWCNKGEAVGVVCYVYRQKKGIFSAEKCKTN